MGAELAVKVDAEAVRPHAAALLKTLVDCFKDESWPVRDRACTATARVVCKFPAESEPLMAELYGLWFAHISDNIPSVRENSAMALVQVIEAIGKDPLDRVTSFLDDNMLKVEEQTSDSKSMGGLENVTQFGVAASKARDNDEALHTDKQMYSCGSLAPKMRRGGGCMDHGFSRAKEPWEITDGCLYLVRELCRAKPDVAETYMARLVRIANVGDFTHAQNLVQTALRCLMSIIPMMKDRVKPVLDDLAPILVRLATDSASRVIAIRAGDVLTDIRDTFPDDFARLFTGETLEKIKPKMR